MHFKEFKNRLESNPKINRVTLNKHRIFITYYSECSLVPNGWIMLKSDNFKKMNEIIEMFK